MHLLSKEDSNSAELETVRVTRSPVTGVTADGEVHTKEEATVCVKELDCASQWSSSKIHQQYRKPRDDCCPMVVNRLLQFIHNCIFNIVFTGRRRTNNSSINNTKSEWKLRSTRRPVEIQKNQKRK